MSSELCSSFKPACVWELQVWLPTEGSGPTLGLQSRQYSHRLWLNLGLSVVPRLHRSFSHVEKRLVVPVVVRLCAASDERLKVHPGACAATLSTICRSPGSERSVAGSFKPELSRPLACQHWKLQIIDLWILPTRFISVAGTGFHSYWELNASLC